MIRRRCYTHVAQQIFGYIFRLVSLQTTNLSSTRQQIFFTEGGSMVLDPPFVWRLHSAYTGHVTAHNLVHLITSRILHGISTWRLRIHRIWTTKRDHRAPPHRGTPWIRSLGREMIPTGGLSQLTPMRLWCKTCTELGPNGGKGATGRGPRLNRACSLAGDGLPKQEKIRRRPEKGWTPFCCRLLRTIVVLNPA